VPALGEHCGLRMTRFLAGGIAAALTLACALPAGVRAGPAAGIPFLLHLGAAVALFWSLAAKALTRPRSHVQQGHWRDEASLGLQWLALGGGVLCAVLLVFEMTVAGLLRTGIAEPVGHPFETSAAGLLDLAALTVAVSLNASTGKTATPLFWLLIASACWSALMIPAAAGSNVAVTRWPAWMPWSLWAFIGMSTVYVAFVTVQEVLFRRRCILACPERPEDLVRPHDTWPGFRPSAAAIGLIILPLGAYHADSPFCALFSALAGAASFWLAHRQWNSNFADVGMALVTLAVTSFMLACIPDSVGGPLLDTRMPLLLAAALFGLSLMIFIWHWLPNVWDQQLHDGYPWTTTGRMIPVTRRFALIVGAFGTLVGMQLAIWPQISSTRDDTVSRWVLGLTANALLIGSLTLAARLSQKRRVAYLALLSVVVMGFFIAVRMPDGRLKYAVLHHWPVMAALAAPVCLGASRLTARGRWRPFSVPLETGAVMTLPGLAVAGLIVTASQPTVILLGKVVQYDVKTLRLATSVVLTLHYALCAWVRGRSTLTLMAVAGFNASVLFWCLSRGFGRVEHAYFGLIPVGLSLMVLAYANRARFSGKGFRRLRLFGVFLVVLAPAWRFAFLGSVHPPILTAVMVALCLGALGLAALLRTRFFIYAGLAGVAVELATLAVYLHSNKRPVPWIVVAALGAAVLMLCTLASRRRHETSRWLEAIDRWEE